MLIWLTDTGVPPDRIFHVGLIFFLTMFWSLVWDIQDIRLNDRKWESLVSKSK